jgi:hypothetical protein
MVWIGLFPEQAVKSACYLHGYTTWAFWVAEHSDRLDQVSDGFCGLSVARTDTFTQCFFKPTELLLISFEDGGMERDFLRCGWFTLQILRNPFSFGI